jgi:hypothetical protein
MIFGWFRSKSLRPISPRDLWEFEHDITPYYNAEHEETMAIIEDILTKLDEIKLLVEEMKKDEDSKDV